MSGNTSAGATADDRDSTLLFSPFDLHRPFYTQRPFAPLLGHRSTSCDLAAQGSSRCSSGNLIAARQANLATRCRSGDTHGHCPARALAGGVAVPAAPSLRAIALWRISPLLRPHPTTALAYATRSSPKFPCRTFGTRRLLCPAASPWPKSNWP